MTADTVQMPQLQVIDKLLKIPLVDIAYNTSAAVYQLMKGCNSMMNWTLESAEGAAALAITVVAPVAKTFQGPIHLIDTTLCRGIDVIQDKVPIVKEPPQQIYKNAKSYVSNSVAVEKVQNLSNASWEKANEVLSTTTVGTMTLSTLDSTSSLADRVIDYCLPAGENEENIHPHPSSECDDKVLHAAHTVGALSVKVSRRVMSTISRRRSVPSTAASSGGGSTQNSSGSPTPRDRSLSQSTGSSVHSSDEE